MFCPTCGRQLSDDARFCPGCGSPATPTEPGTVSGPTASDGPARPEGMPATPAAQAPQPEPQAPRPAPPVSQSPTLDAAGTAEQGMKWFKFVIYAQLFLNAAASLLNAFAFFTGATYGGSADMVYAFYSGLQAVDILFAIIYVALAVAAIYVRMRLAKFRRGAPPLYLMFLVACLAIQILYAVFAMVVTGLSPLDMFDVSTVTSTIATVVLIFANKVYFEKRAHLFVN